MTGSSAESAAFLEFHRNPSSDSLFAVLRAYQVRIYRMCFQVLRDAHDAEDAAQVVLLRIVDEVRKFDEPNSFQRWLNRVSLNAALESARKAARRRAHESRAAMEKPAPPPVDAAGRLALFEAIAALDESQRNLVLERYFEGESLESIAEREGLSPSGVCRQLESARESMRRILGGAMAVAALPNLDRLFPATPPPPDLVSGTVVAKVHSISALASGGAVMTIKSVLLPISAAALLLLFLVGGIATYVFRSSPPPGSIVSGHRQPADRSPGSSSPRPEIEHGTAVLSMAAPESTEEASAAGPSRLHARLDRFKKWWIAIREEEKSVSMDDHEARGEFMKRWEREHWEHVSGLKELILENPEGFLAFLRDKDNEPLIADLTRTSLLDQTDDPQVWTRKPFEEYPPHLMTGLLDLLQSGTDSQRWAALNLMCGLDDVPPVYKNVYVALLDHPNEELQRISITLVMLMVPMTPSLFAKLAALGTKSESSIVRRRVISTMAWHPGPEAEAFVLNRLTAATDHDELRQIMFSLQSRYRGTKPVHEDQLARAVLESMAQIGESQVSDLMTVATFLPGDRLKPILRQAMAKTRYDWYRDGLAKAVERIDEGPFTRSDLMKILEAPR